MDLNKADKVALELIKQVITLASGVLALSAAFIDKLPKTPLGYLSFLAIAWVALIVSIFSGLKTISAIVKSRLKSDDEWSRGRGRTYAQICHYGFLLGISVFAAFAFISLAVVRPKEADVMTIHVTDSRLVETLRHIKKQGMESRLPKPQDETLPCTQTQQAPKH